MELSDDDSYLHLDRDLPDVAAAGLAELVDEFLDRQRPHARRSRPLDRSPRGRRILDCAGRAGATRHAQLRISYDVLAARGNVGTPSIFYVLKRRSNGASPGPGSAV